jgi:hypothetical protein
VAKPARKIEASEATETPVGNIKDLELLAKEFKSNKMPERKLIALRVKLVGLFLEGKTTDDEQELMEAILRKERNQARINSRDNYLLNKIESERCQDSCIVKTDDVPAVHHLKKDLECKYYHDPDYNDGKNRADSIGRYHVYVPREVPTRHQLKNRTVEREILGHPVDPGEYPEPKTLIHKLVLKSSEFNKWFEIIDENILEAAQTEPAYTF